MEIRKVDEVPDGFGRPLNWRVSKYASAINIALDGGIAEIDCVDPMKAGSTYIGVREMLRRNKVDNLKVCRRGKNVYIFHKEVE